MKHPVIHEPVRSPQPGIAPSLDTDDDADRVPGQDAGDADHDVRYETTTRDRPGLADNAGSHAASPQVEFDFGADRERRRH